MANKKFNINLDDSAFTRERRPAVSLFKASSKGGHGETSSTVTTPQAAAQPLSYAQFVVQSKSTSSHGTACSDSPQKPNTGNAFVPPENGLNLKLSADLAKPQPRTEGSEGPAASNTTVSSLRQDEDLAGEKNKEDGEERTVAAHVLGCGNSIIVSPRQRGNPILKFVRNVPWEFGEVVPDYVLGRTTCALFLSLRYHNLNPNYIHERLKTLGQTFMLRVLLVQVDVKDPHHALKELARICVMADCTLILAWSPEEAGRYLETYKSYEKKPADLLQEQVQKDYMSKVTDCLTTVKSINKTDVVTLLSTFSSLEGIINASKEELVLCPGLGPQKARRLYDVLHQPFLMSKTKAS